mmetsp:Transcript_2788/g.7417  ORF Transcript_2788/g.7417 Transcript_2788/m.7417 type:complete len:404 (+) Transcript_2788:1143-2354(+)
MREHTRVVTYSAVSAGTPAFALTSLATTSRTALTDLCVLRLSPMDSSWSKALPHTVRASGSETSSLALSRAGTSLGRKGAASSGSSTSLDMLLMITAHMRLVAVVLTRKPRRRSGAMSARGAAVTVCTKVVDASFWTHSTTSSWSMVAATSAGMKGSTSRLSMELQMFSRHFLAATETCSLESFTICVTTGMMSLSASEMASGEVSARALTVSSAPTMVCHFSLGSMASSMAGRTARTPWPDMDLASTPSAAAAASCTSLLCLSAQQVTRGETRVTIWCSALCLAVPAMAATAMQAPSRLAAVPLDPSARAPASAERSAELRPEPEDLTCSAICDAAVRLASPPSKTEELNTDIMVGVVLKGGWKNPSAAYARRSFDVVLGVWKRFASVFRVPSSFARSRVRW